jgi:hypothetical protein
MNHVVISFIAFDSIDAVSNTDVFDTGAAVIDGGKFVVHTCAQCR